LAQATRRRRRRTTTTTTTTTHTARRSRAVEIDQRGSNQRFELTPMRPDSTLHTFEGAEGSHDHLNRSRQGEEGHTRRRREEGAVGERGEVREMQ
jgi:hypothetical protein